MQTIAQKLRRLLGAVGLTGGLCALALTPSIAFASSVPTITVTPSSTTPSTSQQYTIVYHQNSYDHNVYTLRITRPAGFTLTSTDADINCGSLASGTFCHQFTPTQWANDTSTATIHITATSNSVSGNYHFTFSAALEGGSAIGLNNGNVSVSPETSAQASAKSVNRLVTAGVTAPTFYQSFLKIAPFLGFVILFAFVYYLLRRLVHGLRKAKARL